MQAKKASNKKNWFMVQVQVFMNLVGIILCYLNTFMQFHENPSKQHNRNFKVLVIIIV